VLAGSVNYIVYDSRYLGTIELLLVGLLVYQP